MFGSRTMIGKNALTCTLFIILLVNVAATAQDDRGLIIGRILEVPTGKPLADAVVVATGDAATLRATTDAGGRFELHDLTPGHFHIDAYSPHGPHGEKLVLIGPGQKLAVTLTLDEYGSISGTVLADDKRPFPSVDVFLIAREYHLGKLRYVFAGPRSRTDDRGRYSLLNVPPGRGYAILAQKWKDELPAVSTEPAEIQLRKKVPIPSWYGDSSTAEGSEIVTLNPGERKENIDIWVRRLPSYCIDATLDGPGTQSPLFFWLEEQQPTNGSTQEGATYFMPPHGSAKADGRIRVCDLWPGDFRLTVFGDSLPSFATATVVVMDRDVHNLKVMASIPIAVSVDVALATKSSDSPPLSPTVGVDLEPLSRLGVTSKEERTDTECNVPCHFSFPHVFIDEYTLAVRKVPPDLYIKAITYGGWNVLNQPVSVGSTIGPAELQIVLGSDGGAIAAKVEDDDGKPVEDCSVLIVPVEAVSDAALADALVKGRTDQYGSYASRRIAPGKYYVLATTEDLFPTPESIGRLSRSRSSGSLITLESGQTAQVSLTPKNLN